MSRKILDLAREQQDEIADELGEGDDWEDDDDEDEAEPSTRPRQSRPIDSDDEDEMSDGDVSGGEEEAELVSEVTNVPNSSNLARSTSTPRTTRRWMR